MDSKPRIHVAFYKVLQASFIDIAFQEGLPLFHQEYLPRKKWGNLSIPRFLWGNRRLSPWRCSVGHPPSKQKSTDVVLKTSDRPQNKYHASSPKQPTVFPPLSGGIQIPPLLGNLSRPRSFRNWLGMIGCSNLYCKNLQVFLACCGAKNVNTDNNDNIYILLIYDSDFLNPLGCHFWQIFFLWFIYDLNTISIYDFFMGSNCGYDFFMVWIWFFYDFFMVFLVLRIWFSAKNSRNFRFFYDFARVSFSPKPFQQKIWFWKQNRKKIVKKS